jgi:hypothetical protein
MSDYIVPEAGGEVPEMADCIDGCLWPVGHRGPCDAIPSDEYPDDERVTAHSFDKVFAGLFAPVNQVSCPLPRAFVPDVRDGAAASAETAALPRCDRAAWTATERVASLALPVRLDRSAEATSEEVSDVVN